jgi:hypothetical protein
MPQGEVVDAARILGIDEINDRVAGARVAAIASDADNNGVNTMAVVAAPSRAQDVVRSDLRVIEQPALNFDEYNGYADPNDPVVRDLFGARRRIPVEETTPQTSPDRQPVQIPTTTSAAPASTPGSSGRTPGGRLDRTIRRIRQSRGDTPELAARARARGVGASGEPYTPVSTPGVITRARRALLPRNVAQQTPLRPLPTTPLPAGAQFSTESEVVRQRPAAVPDENLPSTVRRDRRRFADPRLGDLNRRINDTLDNVRQRRYVWE